VRREEKYTGASGEDTNSYSLYEGGRLSLWIFLRNGGDSRYKSGVDDPRRDLTQLIERLHRRYLDVIRVELDRIGCRDLTPVQAVLLANVGDDDIVIKELVERGYYQGSNVSYNMKKLVDGGYIKQERSSHDKRSVRISLTPKSKEVCDRVRAMESLSPDLLKRFGIDEAELNRTRESLERIERAWSDFVRYRR
jgi:DNA-binding MarR family transcriptional regulator